MRTSRPLLTAGLLISALAVTAAPGAAATATDRAAGRDYHTLSKVKKSKFQACLGPVIDTAVGPGVTLYVRLNNKGANVPAYARVTTNLLNRDFYAMAHRSDSGKYAVLALDEAVRVKYAAYKKTVEFEVVAGEIGPC